MRTASLHQARTGRCAGCLGTTSSDQLATLNDQHDQAHELREPFEELASRLVDLRGIARPPTFSGMPEDWGEFRFRFEAVAGLLNLDTMLQRIAAQQQNAFLTPSERAQSKLTYNMLVQLVHGKALALLRLVRRHDGVAAWQALLKEYEPAQPARFCATLTQLLRPEWDESKPFMEQLWEWERRVADYEVETGMPMPDTYKCSVVARSSPPGIRAFLRLQTDDVTESFARLKQAIDSYQLRGRTFEYVDSMATVPMDVGAITGDARPYAKGGGKAVGDREVARGSSAPLPSLRQEGAHLRRVPRSMEQLSWQPGQGQEARARAKASGPSRSLRPKLLWTGRVRRRSSTALASTAVGLDIEPLTVDNDNARWWTMATTTRSQEWMKSSPSTQVAWG